MSDEQNPVENSSRFATTQWSMVVSAGKKSSPDSEKALESLCEIYWFPLYAYVRRRVADANEAQDLTQSFFAELLEKNYVGAADPDRGRFRAFLLTALKHYLSKQWEKEKALKRGGGKQRLSLDFESADSSIKLQLASGLSPEQLYDQQWAVALLGRIMQRLRTEHVENEKVELFDELKDFVIGDHSGRSYADAAATLNISEAASRKAASRIRQRYRELLREEISHTVSDGNDVDQEIRNLFSTFQS